MVADCLSQHPQRGHPLFAKKVSSLSVLTIEDPHLLLPDAILFSLPRLNCSILWFCDCRALDHTAVDQHNRLWEGLINRLDCSMMIIYLRGAYRIIDMGFKGLRLAKASVIIRVNLDLGLFIFD